MAEYNIRANLNLNLNAASVRPAISSLQAQLKNTKVEIPVKFDIDKNSIQQLQAQNAQLKAITNRLNSLSRSAKNASTNINSLGQSLVNIAATFNSFAAQNQQLNNVASNIKNMNKAASQASNTLNQGAKDAQSFAEAIGISAKRFSTFAIAAGSIASIVYQFSSAIKAAAEFDLELVKLKQIGRDTPAVLKSIADEVGYLSRTYGVSSKELIKAAGTLKQAGLATNEVKTALKTLALTDVSPTFESIDQTVEGVIATMAQFKEGIGALENQFGAINRVAADFAVESGDIVDAIRRSGAAFKAAGGNLNEFLALFTSVRATTRESAESIATGFRTIFARLERPETIKRLRGIGVELQNLQGQFVGPFEAVKRLNQALREIPSTDIRFAQVVEEIGGIRQFEKVIPLIQEFPLAMKAYNSALKGQGSLTEDAAIRQEAFITQLNKLKESFLELFRTISQDKSIQTALSSILALVNSLNVALKTLTPLVPILVAGAAIGIGRGLPGTFQNFKTGFQGKQYAEGGQVPRVNSGITGRDSTPIYAEPGEYVLKKSVAQKIGYSTLNKINHGGGGNNGKFAEGGEISPVDIVRAARRVGKEGEYSEYKKYINKVYEQLVKEKKYSKSLDDFKKLLTKDEYRGISSRIDLVQAGDEKNLQESKLEIPMGFGAPPTERHAINVVEGSLPKNIVEALSKPEQPSRQVSAPIAPTPVPTPTPTKKPRKLRVKKDELGPFDKAAYDEIHQQKIERAKRKAFIIEEQEKIREEKAKKERERNAELARRERENIRSERESKKYIPPNIVNPVMAKEENFPFEIPPETKAKPTTLASKLKRKKITEVPPIITAPPATPTPPAIPTPPTPPVPPVPPTPPISSTIVSKESLRDPRKITEDIFKKQDEQPTRYWSNDIQYQKVPSPFSIHSSTYKPRGIGYTPDELAQIPPSLLPPSMRPKPPISSTEASGLPPIPPISPPIASGGEFPEDDPSRIAKSISQTTSPLRSIDLESALMTTSNIVSGPTPNIINPESYGMGSNFGPYINRRSTAPLTQIKRPASEAMAASNLVKRIRDRRNYLANLGTPYSLGTESQLPPSYSFSAGLQLSQPFTDPIQRNIRLGSSFQQMASLSPEKAPPSFYPIIQKKSRSNLEKSASLKSALMATRHILSGPTSNITNTVSYPSFGPYVNRRSTALLTQAQRPASEAIAASNLVKRVRDRRDYLANLGTPYSLSTESQLPPSYSFNAGLQPPQPFVGPIQQNIRFRNAFQQGASLSPEEAAAQFGGGLTQNFVGPSANLSGFIGPPTSLAKRRLFPTFSKALGRIPFNRNAALFGVGAAAAAAPSLLESGLGTASQPGRFGTTGAKTGAILGGALAGGATGALLGGSLGASVGVGAVPGAIIGGLAGGITGAIGALQKFEDELEKVNLEKFDKAIQNISIDFEKGTTKTALDASQLSEAFNKLLPEKKEIAPQEEQRGFGLTVSKPRKQTDFEVLQQVSDVNKEKISDQALQILQGIAQKNPGKSVDELSRGFGNIKTKAGDFSLFKALGLKPENIDNFIKFQSLLKESNDIQKKINDVQKNSISLYDQLSASLETFSQSMEMAGENFEKRQALSDIGSNALLGKTSIGIGAPTISALGGNASLIGEFSKTGGGFDQAKQAVVESLQSVLSNKGQLGEGERLNQGLEAAKKFGESKAGGGIFGKEIANSIQDYLNKQGLNTESAVQAGGVNKVAEQILRPFEEIKKTGERGNQILQKVFDQYGQSVSKLAERQLDVDKKRIGLVEQRGEALRSRGETADILNPGFVIGGPSLAERGINREEANLQSGFRASQNILTGLPGREAVDPQALVRRIKEQQGRLGDLSFQQGQAKAANNGMEFKRIGDEISKTSDKIGRFKMALDNVANSTIGVEIANKRLKIATDKFQGDLESRRKDAETLTFGSASEKFGLLQRENITQQALQLGPEQFQFLPDSIKKVVQQRLDETPNMQRTQYRINPYTGEQYGKPITFSSAEAKEALINPQLRALQNSPTVDILRENVGRARIALNKEENKKIAAGEATIGVDQGDIVRQQALLQANFQQTIKDMSRNVDQQMVAFQQFEAASSVLADALNSFTGELHIKREGQVNVILNGAEVLAKFRGDMEKEIINEIVTQLQDKLPKALKNAPAR